MTTANSKATVAAATKSTTIDPATANATITGRRRRPSNELATRTGRAKLAVRKKPYSVILSPGIQLAYRRNKGAGAWSVKTSAYLMRFAVADDHEVANNDSVMDYEQAQTKARMIARADDGVSERPITVTEAVDAYQDDLKARGAGVANASHIRFNLKDKPALASKPVALLTKKDLSDWRNGLVKRGLLPSSADRISKSFKAALNLAASNDDRIKNEKAWKDGMKNLTEDDSGSGDGSNNIILPINLVAATVKASYKADRKFGLVIEVLASTGTRESQMWKLKVRDFIDDPLAPRLMMPSSKKGKKRKIDYKPLPIPLSLAAALRQQAIGRAPADPLFDKIPRISDKFRPVADIVGLVPEASPYCLRHSSIAAMLLNHIPTRVVASHHDTSVAMIEKHYSKRIIGEPTDAMVRQTLVDFMSPTNVFPIKAA
jgi:integrase